MTGPSALLLWPRSRAGPAAARTGDTAGQERNVADRRMRIQTIATHSHAAEGSELRAWPDHCCNTAAALVGLGRLKTLTFSATTSTVHSFSGRMK
jgi:hypothetical protein